MREIRDKYLSQKNREEMNSMLKDGDNDDNKFESDQLSLDEIFKNVISIYIISILTSLFSLLFKIIKHKLF